jgi:hypothetical protein
MMNKQLLFTFLVAVCCFRGLVGQTIQIKDNGDCYSNSVVQNFNIVTNAGGSPPRNTFTATLNNANGNNPMRVIWVGSPTNQWQVQQFFGGAWVRDYYNTTATRPNPPALGFGTWVSDGCGLGLTRFDGTGTQSVLPIELTQFDANTEGSKNRLTWATTSEVDNKGFDIERSFDGKTFTAFGQVKGNNKPSSYQYVDNQPFNTTYYRLKQIDFDGTETYSKIVSVELKGKAKGLKVYPTLVSDGVLTLDTEGGQLSDFSVMNLLGQQVLVGKTTTQIDVSSLAKGTYILKVGTDVAKFVKQ